MKRFLSFLLVSVMLLGILAACGGDAATTVPAATTAPATDATAVPATEPTAAPGGTGTTPEVTGEVTLWHAYGTGSAEEATIAKLIANAQAANPNATINVLQVPFSDIFNKFQNEVAAGGGPDLFVAPNDSLGDQVRASLLLDITDKVASLPNLGAGALEGMTVDGKIYGVPESFKAVGLYYNTSTVATPPATTAELLAAVKAGKKLVLNQNAYHSFGFYQAFGGKVLDGNKCGLTTGGTEAVAYLQELKAAGATFVTDGGQGDSLFKEGKADMIINGPWALGDYRAALSDKLAVAAMPAGPAGPAGPLTGVDGFYLNINSANPDGALALALFLTSTESQQIYTDEAGHTPVNTLVKITDPTTQGFADAAKTGVARPQNQAFSNYWGPFGDVFTKAIEGGDDAKTTIAEACAAMDTANADVPESTEPTAAPGGGTSTGPEVTGEVTLWHAYGTGSAEEATMVTLIANAQAANPNATINVLQVPFSDIFNKFQNEVAAGGGPDLFLAPNDSLGDQVRASLLLDITDKVADLPNLGAGALEGMTVDGKIYGVPESFKAVGLYYNTSTVATPPATTAELLAAVKAGKKLVLNQNAYHSFGFYQAFGGKVLDGDKCGLTTGGTEAVAYLQELKAAGATFVTDGGQGDSLFKEGKADMIINGPWALGDYRGALGDKLAVAAMPAGPAGPAGPLTGVDGFYLNINSANPDGALALALFLTNTESQQIYTDQAGHTPTSTLVKITDPTTQGFADAAKTGVARPQDKAFSNYWGPFGDVFTKAIEGGDDAKTTIAEACAAMDTANQ